MDAQIESRWHGHDARGSDEGFTLIEVIVALAVMSIVATGALYFFVGGTKAATAQQRQQGAVSLANDAMEDAFSLVARASTTGTSGLVTGRTELDVTTAWTAATAAGTPGIADSYPAWDKATTPVAQSGVGDDALPLVDTVKNSGTTYTVTSLIGFCYRDKTTPTAQCDRTGGSALGVANAGKMMLMRSVVSVTWPDTAGTCKARTCRYEIASLVDPSNDLKWNNTTRMLAVDDSVAVNADATVDVDVLDNDTLMSIPQGTPSPVSVFSQPVLEGTSTPAGTAVALANGHILYDPSDDAWGAVTFTYRVSIYSRTVQATVHAYVTPMARAITAPATSGGSVAIPVTTMWNAPATGLAIVSPPTGGTVSTSGSTFTYTAPTTAVPVTHTFRYTFTRGTYTSTEGVVTVLVTPPVPAAGGNRTFDLLATVNATEHTLDLRGSYPPNNPPINPPTYKLKIGSLPTAGTLKIDGATAAVGSIGMNVTFTPPPQTAGYYTFTFQVAPDGASTDWSPPGTATVKVHPQAAGDPETTFAESKTGLLFRVGANDGSVAGTTIQIRTQPTCATIATNQSGAWTSGDVRIDTPRVNSNQTCSFTYRLVPIDNRLATTADVTARLRVRNG